MKTMKTSELRQNLQEVLDTVFYKGESVLITKSNKPRVIISPLPKDATKTEDAVDAHEMTTKYVK